MKVFGVFVSKLIKTLALFAAQVFKLFLNGLRVDAENNLLVQTISFTPFLFF